MTKMLASVSNLHEAEIVLTEQVDIIDLKNPAAGSLGRLAADEITKIVDFVADRCPLSATIGDLPMEPQLILSAVEEVKTTDVSFIKIGLCTNAAGRQVIENLSRLTSTSKLIAVLFADQAPDLSVVSDLKAAGFFGVMLDTFDKKRGGLCQVMDKSKIMQFVNLAKVENLLCGLAGSLAIADIPGLLTIKPDYLGFRGALCNRLNRVNAVDSANVIAIKHLLSNSC